MSIIAPSHVSSEAAPARIVRRSRCCPACAETRCADPAQCLYFLTSRPWGACDGGCGGTGWASEADYLYLFCPHCFGSGLMEYAIGATLTPDQVTDASAARLAQAIEDLKARLAAAS